MFPPAVEIVPGGLLGLPVASVRAYTPYTTVAEKLMPKGKPSYEAVLRAFELEKALYELTYELSYRPDWAEIPRGAIRRLTGV